MAHAVFGIAQTINSANYIYFKCMEKVQREQKGGRKNRRSPGGLFSVSSKFGFQGFFFSPPPPSLYYFLLFLLHCISILYRHTLRCGAISTYHWGHGRSSHGRGKKDFFLWRGIDRERNFKENTQRLLFLFSSHVPPTSLPFFSSSLLLSSSLPFPLLSLILQQAGIVEHLCDLLDDFQLVLWNAQP